MAPTLPPQIDLFARSRPSSAGSSRVLSVSELTRELKGTVEGRFIRIAVRGEISNFRPASSGHVYFTLKDDGACIAAVLFRAESARLKFRLKDGLLVVACGRVTIYEARGQYQLICDTIEPEGAGALALAFEQLKAKLKKEGLFDPARKRPIPFLPKCIGVVTSPSGAALQDFLHVLHERFPIPVVIAGARVQGEGAAQELANAVARLAASGRVDVIVVTRGGGSIEDLWAFNEEVLARAIAASPVPVVSAVGHEVDFTIADFVADKRCATPTDAAKTLAPFKEDLLKALDKHKRHLAQIALRLIGLRRERLHARHARLLDPRMRISNDRLVLDQASERMRRAVERHLSLRRNRIQSLSQRIEREHPRNRLGRLGNALTVFKERSEKAVSRKLSADRLRLTKAVARLESLSPLAVLARGYSVAFLSDRRVLRSAEQAPPGTDFSLLLPDRSELTAKVTSPKEAPFLARESSVDE